MARWFYTSGGQQVGPLEEGQFRSLLASGQIRPDDLVWGEGMPQWVPAAQLAGAPVAAPVAAGVPAGAGAAGAVHLTYASPVVPEAPAVGHDEGPFLKIGGSYTVAGGNRWTGATYASPRAVYLLKGSQQMSGAAYGIGGLAGALLHKALTTPDDVRTCCVRDLPEPVRQQLDRKGKLAAKDVIVLPRDAIHLVKKGSFNNVYSFQLGGDKFTVQHNLFGGGKIRRFLEGNGWTLNQEMTPTAAPIHGRGLGRTFEEAEAKKPSTVKRVVLAVVAIAFIILVIVARVLSER